MTLPALALAFAVSAGAASFDVKSFGAKGNGDTLDTTAIQKAIDAAAKAGGTVVVPAGTYRTGAIFVKSGVELRLEKGATLLGSREIADYPEVPTRVAGIEMRWPSALVNVYEQSNVRITGQGTLDGDGKKWYDLYWKMRREEYEPKGVRWAVDYDCRRPRLIQVYKSTGVTLQGLSLRRSGFWTVHLCYSSNVTVDGLDIRNNVEARGPSTDGINIDSSSGVTVTHCTVECNDDAFCLKAGRDADGLRVNRPTRNVTLRDNVVVAGAAGVTIGSETSGGFRDIVVERLKVRAGVPFGIYFKSASTRGGAIENIVIRDVEMDGVPTVIGISLNWNPTYSYARIPDGMTGYPDYWKVLTTPVPPEKGIPHFRDITISGVNARGAQRAFQVASHPDSPLLRFRFRDLDIEAKTAGSIAGAKDWTFTGLNLKTVDGSRVELKDSQNVQGLPH
jgi:polygalacturonase